MKRILLPLIILMLIILASAVPAFASVFVIEYESYKWNPCNGNMCLAISCPVDGCVREGKHIICKDESCITDILDKYGEDHLTGIWKIDYKSKTSEKLQYQKRYKLDSILTR